MTKQICLVALALITVLALLAAGALLAGIAYIPAARAVAASTQCEVDQCLVLLIDEAEVPAQEAGVLKTLLVKEGQQVAAGEDGRNRLPLDRGRSLVAQLAEGLEQRIEQIEGGEGHEG